MIDFAYNGIFHVYRQDGEDLVEELTQQTILSHGHLSVSDCGLEDIQHELEQMCDNQISKLPTGIHVVWVTGVVKFFDYETDCGREYDSAVGIDKEVWRPATEDEIRWAAEDSGADLSDYLKPEPPMTAFI